MSRLPSSSVDAARKWPMLVMHEPMKTSSIFVSCTSDSSFASSGSFGQHSSGSVDRVQVDLDHGGVLGVASAFQQARAWPARPRRP
jgi:hypothetical protein